VVDRAEALLSAPGSARRLLGIAGPPGAGKSTLAARLVDELAARHGRQPPLVGQAPMDGFHLPNAELRRRGLAGRKGAPETFDAAGYAALLATLRADHPGEVAAPSFSRVLDEPVAGAHVIGPSVRLVLCEGNYLLLDTGDWARVRACCHEVWYLSADADRTRPRLLARHRSGGRTPDEARAWVESNDLVNGRLVARTAARADHLVDLAPVDLAPGDAAPGDLDSDLA